METFSFNRLGENASSLTRINLFKCCILDELERERERGKEVNLGERNFSISMKNIEVEENTFLILIFWIELTNFLNRGWNRQGDWKRSVRLIVLGVDSR